MNAAAKLLNHGVFFRGWAVSIFIARAQASTFVLISSLLLTGLSIVYVTNCNRCLHATLQQKMIERDHLRNDKAQLLLERSTWAMQTRIHTLAKNELQMDVPNSNSLVIVSE